jgi:hypothetical protein
MLLSPPTPCPPRFGGFRADLVVCPRMATLSSQLPPHRVTLFTASRSHRQRQRQDPPRPLAASWTRVGGCPYSKRRGCCSSRTLKRDPENRDACQLNKPAGPFPHGMGWPDGMGRQKQSCSPSASAYPFLAPFSFLTFFFFYWRSSPHPRTEELRQQPRGKLLVWG